MQFKPIRRKRRGAVLVEALLTTTVFLTLIFGLIDLGMALFYEHIASEAARQGARNAIVHGYLAPADSKMNAWGPTPSYSPALTTQSVYASATYYSVHADDPSDELAGTIRPYLAGLDPSTARIQIEWPDGNNDPGNRVTVTVAVSYQHPIPFVFGDDPISLCASSTMTVVH